MPNSLPDVQPRQLEFLGFVGFVHQNLWRWGAVRAAFMQQPTTKEQRPLLHWKESHLQVLQRHSVPTIK